MNEPGYFDIRNELADTLLAGSHQLAGVPERDRGKVLRAAVEAVPKAAEMLRSYPALYADGTGSASRLAFSCLSAAATFPDGTRDEIADLGALTVILFGVDDIADSVVGRRSAADFADLFGALVSILRGEEGQESGEQVVRAWAQWCERLRARPGAPVHVPAMADQLALAGEAMARERAWASGADPWPSYDDYVANGMLTILYHTWWAAALAILGPLPAGAGHWAAIEEATHLGATCLRLANDIRSFERERAEGKPNSIAILQRQGLAVHEAVRRVSAHIDVLDARFTERLAELPAELKPVAVGQRRSVAFNGRWYLARDTHDYTVDDLESDLRSLQGEV
ncbi:terpene synthase family protein [Nonomuraea sediminis]|uniref:terpene synthase family protein n=1 Tax=Nonomuraea sediminis TaxID=2835864 RepID=UPI001BDCE33D|nr:terpene synthase family protein [Nonomuraea sediminis]